MSNGIFTIQADGSLVETIESSFPSEEIFQRLLAAYPSLIAGDQVDPDEPRRWLLVTREAGVPDEQEAPDRWSVDHLFLDQDGIPTFVEVKRSSDTRIRREVVGQMLDYAANGVAYWKADGLQALFEQRCEEEQRSASAEYAALLGADADVDTFWQRVKTNLQAGKIRMVFVADVIPPELRAIVAFLNQQMDPAEVLALEIKQYVGGGLRTLVPRVYGQTEGALRKQPRVPRRQWDETSFLADLERQSPNCGPIVNRVLAWARAHELREWWGKGAQVGSYYPMIGLHSFVAFWSSGEVEVQFANMRKRPPFDDQALRTEVLRRFNQIPGVVIPDDKLGGFPRFAVTSLAAPGALDAFLALFEWYRLRALTTP